MSSDFASRLSHLRRLGGLLSDAGYFCQVYATDPMQFALQARRRGVQRGAIFKLCQVLADAIASSITVTAQALTPSART